MRLGRFQRMVKRSYYVTKLTELMYGPLQFQKRSRYFIDTHDEPLSVAMCVNNPDRSAFKIDR